ncbi:MAG: cytochrome c peroxidase [Planctomycetota bacterium]|nr:cytochrome c peroxidase [Planctomycetota bacterium]
MTAENPAVRFVMLIIVAAVSRASISAQVVTPVQSSLQLSAPKGLPSPVPGSDTFRPAVAGLGRTLFFDTSLSIDRKISCSSCHAPEHGFASVEALPAGSLGRRALRNAPTLYNRAYGKAFSWDGRAKTLEEQVILPISNANEMALPLEDAILRLRKDESYAKKFAALFGREATAQDLSVALASFTRTLVHADTVVDDFRAGQVGHLTRSERTGMWIFESKGGCWRCHTGPNLTDEAFHNTGIGVAGGKSRPGRMAITNDPADAGGFKTPTLRALAETAPYMHDGSLATLAEVVAFYRRGGNENPRLDRKMKPLALSDQDALHLVAFLRALSRRSAFSARGK